MNIIYKEKESDYEKVLQVINEVIPERAGYDISKTRDAYENSSYTVFAYDGDRLVASARVLDDGYEWTLISEIAVLKDYQEKGIGKTILNKIIEKYKGHEIFVYTYPEQLSFFEKYGFNRSKNAFTYSGVDGEYIERSLLNKGFFLPVGYKYENEFYPVIGDFPAGVKSKKDKASVKITFSNKFEDVDLKRLNEVLSLAFSSHPRDIELTKGAFSNSQYYSFAFDGDLLVGCARAVSDKTTQGLILNVAIDPAYQGLSLGWNVVSKLSEQMKGQNIYLNTHPAGVGFYNRKGFRRNKTALLYPSNPDMPLEIKKEFVLPAGYRFADEIEDR